MIPIIKTVRDVMKNTPKIMLPASSELKVFTILKKADCLFGFLWKKIRKKEGINPQKNIVVNATITRNISVFINLNLTQNPNFVNPNLKEALT